MINSIKKFIQGNEILQAVAKAARSKAYTIFTYKCRSCGQTFVREKECFISSINSDYSMDKINLLEDHLNCSIGNTPQIGIADMISFRREFREENNNERN